MNLCAFAFGGGFQHKATDKRVRDNDLFVESLKSWNSGIFGTCFHLRHFQTQPLLAFVLCCALCAEASYVASFRYVDLLRRVSIFGNERAS